MTRIALLVCLGCLGSLGSVSRVNGVELPETERAMADISPRAIQAHMGFLADDLLEGRGTGTRGYRIAAQYVAAQFAAMGLRPAGDSESYFQEVPLRWATLDVAACEAALLGPEGEIPLVHARDLLFSKNLEEAHGEAEGALVYVGYGVTAPEFDYDDYAALDVRGKILVMLRGAPARFPHNERAFYSDSDQKYRNAVDRGAIGVLQLRTPDSSRYFPWEKNVALSRMPAIGMIGKDGRVVNGFPEIRVSARLSEEGAKRLFEGATHALEEVFLAAKESRPLSFELPRRIRLESRSDQRDSSCVNVVAVLPGADPELQTEVVVYSAHLDHFGMDVSLEGDQIYNGAYDNASGIAVLIEVARAMTSLPSAPARSVLFLAVTGEERGLLGSEYFAAHPTVPADRLVADVNLDMFLMLHPCLDVIAFGAEHSSLGESVTRAADRLGIGVSPDPEPEESIFIRSDQYSFVKIGVPSVFLVAGRETKEGGDRGRELEETWDRDFYHTPRDDMSQPIDFEAGATFARLNFLLGIDLADHPKRPTWNVGDFFGTRFAR